MKSPPRTRDQRTRSEAAAPEPTSPPWRTLVLVCEKCKGARKGLDTRDIRKGIKQRAGKNKSLRVLESPCMKVCPDDATTVCVVRTDRASEVVLVRRERELDALVEALTEASE